MSDTPTGVVDTPQPIVDAVERTLEEFGYSPSGECSQYVAHAAWLASLQGIGRAALVRAVPQPTEREVLPWEIRLPKSAVVETIGKCRVYADEDGQHWMDDGTGAVPLVILRAERVRIVDDNADIARRAVPPPEPSEEPLTLALRNVLGMATRMKRYGPREEDVDHLIRFCAEAGVVPSVLRGSVPQEEAPP